MHHFNLIHLFSYRKKDTTKLNCTCCSNEISASSSSAALFANSRLFLRLRAVLLSFPAKKIHKDVALFWGKMHPSRSYEGAEVHLDINVPDGTSGIGHIMFHLGRPRLDIPSRTSYLRHLCPIVLLPLRKK